MLAAIARTVATEGHSRVKPSAYFKPMAQIISSPAAINSMIQYLFMNWPLPAIEKAASSSEKYSRPAHSLQAARDDTVYLEC
jgi:hypothetical protein